jgi:hypothetical protein
MSDSVRGDPAITRDVVDHESQLAGGPVKAQWDPLDDEGRDAYVQRLAANVGEPAELLALSADDPAAEIRWRLTHFLVRAEFCAFINESRFGWQRKRRAKTALDAAPRQTPPPATTESRRLRPSAGG